MSVNGSRPGESSWETPVLIVGGGPTGLLLAYLLSKLGVKSIVAEKYLKRLESPKAHALSPRSLEICRQSDIDAAALRRLGTPRDEARWVNFCTTLDDDRIGRLPYERMDPEVLNDTPEMIHNIPQPSFETYLAGLLAKDSNVEIHKGLAFVSCTQDDQEVTSSLDETQKGRKIHVRSKHVVGCDGAKSAVRKCLGIECEGEATTESMMTIHFRADITPVLGEHVGMLHWCTDPAVSGFIIGYDTEGDMVLISSFDPIKRPAEKWSLEDGKRAVLAAIGRDIPLDVRSCRPWILSRQVAYSYRSGRVLLAGDAAHAFPPTGGLGLNCGLADVHNLAWKLAFVQQGRASDTLLDTYQAERRPVAVAYAEQSAENGKTIFSFLKKLGIAGIDNEQAARENLHRTVRDPTKQSMIAEGVEGQREHFDNLGLHIGYVYGQTARPACASTYIPSYELGARLPHSWINGVSKDVLSHQPPLDLSYVNELSATERKERQYSILDLCNPNAFTLLQRSGGADRWQSIVHQLAESKVKLNIRSEGQDFAFSINAPGGWVKNEILLVRPDQHLLLRADVEGSVEMVKDAILQYLA